LADSSDERLLLFAEMKHIRDRLMAWRDQMDTNRLKRLVLTRLFALRRDNASMMAGKVGGKVPVRELWGNTGIVLPRESSREWRGLIHGERLAATDGTLRLADIFSALSVAALSSIRPPSSDLAFT
jgi:hypothetical protein